MLTPLVAIALLAAPQDPSTLLDEATRAFAELELEAVEPLVTRALEHSQVTPDQRVAGNFLLGAVLAVLDDQLRAEQRFRLVMRARPGFELPSDTSPKIVAIFRKVEIEERDLRDKLARIDRDGVLRNLTLSGDPPVEAIGGEPLPFRYRITDRTGIVGGLRLMYRARRGEQPAPAEYSSIPLRLDAAGQWHGEIPPAYTASETGLNVEYYLESSERDGTLLRSYGEPESPMRLAITPGTLEETTPFYQSPWFWTVVGTVAAAAIAGASYGIYDAITPPCGPNGCHDFE